MKNLERKREEGFLVLESNWTEKKKCDFFSDLIVRYLLSSHLRYYVNEPAAGTPERKIKVNKIK